ncbi:hypothetical protein [Sphingomonas sp.]|uniref:hypothetical protein n=1 Tax=Sphingomonas sp. TaxID=28214 RepID=UPI0031E34F38
MTVFTLRATTALIPFVFLAAPAAGQDGQAPVVITPPVGDFSLPPSGQTPTPRPTAAPTPAPTAAPIVQPVPLPTPTLTRAVPPRASAPRSARTPAATAPVATPTPSPASTPSPTATVPVQATPVPTPTPAPVAESSAPGWLWPVLGGAVLLVGGGLAGWWIGRRRGAREEAIDAEVMVAPVAPPAPTPGPPPLERNTPPAAPVPPVSPARAQAPVAPVPAPDGPLVAEIRPLRAAIRDGQVTLDFELFVQNRGHEPADNIRAVLALLGANAEQDAQIASFHSASRLAAGSEPFSLAPGAVNKLNAQVSLPGEQMQVVQVQGKAMFVPIVPLALKWYAGLSIRTLRDSFMVGTAPAPGSDKLGPLWVERAASGFGQLAAKRYVPRAGA